MPTPLLLPLFGLAAFFLGGASLSLAATELLKASPFVLAANAGNAPAGAGETIQFAGVSTMGTTTYVSLFDTQTKKARWYAVGTAIDGTTVVSYDEKTDQVLVRINGIEKRLTLRKASAIANGVTPGHPIMNQPATGFSSSAAASSPQALLNHRFHPAPVESASGMPIVNRPAGPIIPQTQARQETEARMLVSDLLEIGMAQRKAYEEAQRRASQPGQATPGSTEAAAVPSP